MSDRANQIYDYIKANQRPIAPTVRAIARDVGVPSTSSVDYHLQQLIKRGRLIEHIEHKHGRRWYEFTEQNGD